MAKAVSPVTNVPVSEELVIAGGVEPDVSTKSVLQVILPVSTIALVAGEPVHLTVAVSLIVLPVALIVVLAGVDHLAGAPLHAALPLALVERTILVAKLTIAVSHAVLPITVVFNAFLFVDVFALAMAQAIQNITFVCALIWPRIGTLASDLVLSELSTVDSAIGPFEDTTAAKQTPFEFSLILVAVLELARSVTVIHFTDLYFQKKETKFKISI